MLTPTLLKHNWLKTIRARGFYKNLTVNILLGILALYFIAIFFIFGLFLHEMLNSIATDKTPTQIFNGITLYIILVGLLIRYLMQQLATINIQTYQILPLKRTTVVNYLLFSPLLNPVNYILFFTVIPFAIRSVAIDYNAMTALRFVLNFFFIVCFNSLTASFIKRKFGSNFWGFVGVVVAFGAIIAMEYYQLFSLFAISGIFFDFIVLNPFGLLAPILAVGLIYSLNHRFFAQNFYVERFDKQIRTEKYYTTSHFSFLNRFGIIGEIMALNIKLIMRHKRTKSLLYFLPVFLCYGLIFYTNEYYMNSYGYILFCAILMIGAATIPFGQWIIGWNSSHFDCFMTRNFSIRNYISASLNLMLAGNIICFILTLPYFLYGKNIAIAHIVAFLFNAGVNNFLLIYFATYKTKRIDLSNRSVMNFQGTTFWNFLIVIPVMFFPMILVGLFAMFSKTNIALIILSIMGVVGLLFQKQMVTLCVNQFYRRKYALCEGFRQAE
jgi:hypothetical protein